MENKDYNTAQRLLMMAPQDEPEEEQDQIQENSGIKPHQTENIIPPIGIAKPELVDSFMENIGDEEKILQDIKDITDYHNENKFETAEREAKSYGLRALEGLGGTVGGLLNALSGVASTDWMESCSAFVKAF